MGCGTSFLSFHLRVYVDDPAQIHNVDFSAQAIELGKVKETEMFGADEHTSSSGTTALNGASVERAQPVFMRCERAEIPEMRTRKGRRMRWSTADLLSLPSLDSTCGNGKYAVVVEKSTSDATACGKDVEVGLPFRLTPSSGGSKSHAKEHAFIHPVDILALHLASPTQPGGRWIALSYSAACFPFLSEVEEKRMVEQSYPEGFPDPATYRRLERKEPIEDAQTGNAKASDCVHRPEVVHWLYV